jgi:phosphoribosylglycinamide formyltransferase-1
MREDARLKRLSQLCAAFPEVKRELSSGHATFRVRRKPFAYFLSNHHGDGIVAFCWKTQRGENRDWVAQDGRRFFLPAYIGPRGWAGLRLDVGPPDWAAIEGFARDSYRLTAPRRLAARLAPTRTANPRTNAEARQAPPESY